MVDISFEFAKIYNIDKKIDVAIGQKFSIKTDFAGVSNFFNDNDPVLSIIVVDGNNIQVEATAPGSSTILIMDAAFAIKKELTIKVVEAINDPATDLGIQADGAIPK